MLNKQAKQKIINSTKQHDTDTGSAEVQIAILSVKIKKLSDHLKDNHKDNHSRRGLLKMVAHRKKLISYLKGKDEVKLKDLAEEFNFKV